jgi:hypothetical protein
MGEAVGEVTGKGMDKNLGGFAESDGPFTLHGYVARGRGRINDCDGKFSPPTRPAFRFH